MFTFTQPRPKRRLSLTPMIDVVFLLLVFFMLAARFGTEGAIALTTGGGGEGWQGPPRLVEFSADGLWLNGVETGSDDLAQSLRALMPDEGLPVILRPRAGADTQALVSLLEVLREEGLANLVLVEGE